MIEDEYTLGHGKQRKRILIADHQPLFRQGLRALLGDEGDLEVVGDATDAGEALKKVHLLSPDVLVVDLALLQSDGQPSALTLRKAHPTLAMLFLTQEDAPQRFEFAVSAGAQGYMVKNSPPSLLVEAVRRVAAPENQNGRSLSSTIPDLHALSINNGTQPPHQALTSREQEVMQLLAEGSTVREVASELSLSIKTIEAHKLNLMRKLHIHNRASLVQYAVNRGLVRAQPVR